MDSRTRTRRDHEKYLTLIDAMALLHQYQREVRRAQRGGKGIEYIEATLQDIAHANRLADQVLGRSLDELPPQTRAFLEGLERWVAREAHQQGIERSEHRFTARRAREALGTGATQTKVHLARLLELEYLLLHRTGNQVLYELLYAGEGRDGGAFLIGLLDAQALEGLDADPQRSGRREVRSALSEERSGSGRPPAGARSGAGRNGRGAAKERRENSLSSHLSRSSRIPLSASEETLTRTDPPAEAPDEPREVA